MGGYDARLSEEVRTGREAMLGLKEIGLRSKADSLESSYISQLLEIIQCIAVIMLHCLSPWYILEKLYDLMNAKSTSPTGSEVEFKTTHPHPTYKFCASVGTT